MVFISAGHNPKGQRDPGAVSGNLAEADLTEEFKNILVPIAKGLGLKIVTDKPDEKLADYLKRIKPGNGSVVIEFHFDSAVNKSASGATSIVGSDADRFDKLFAKEIVDATAQTLEIKNRGVINEAESNRGRLGLMREQGIVTLLEIGFISNPDDVKKYQQKKIELATRLASIIKKYEDLIS